jgi:P-type Cu+ transporter
MERDPVCGMMVDPARAQATAQHARTTYYFCGQSCAARFQAAPEKYLRPKAPRGATPAPAPVSSTPHVPAGKSAAYTCPMHPEVVRQGPGSCPICGMALEPRTAVAEDAPSEELLSMTRRFWISVALAVSVVALGMSDLIPRPPLYAVLTAHAIGVIQLVLATPLVLWAGWPLFAPGCRSSIAISTCSR